MVAPFLAGGLGMAQGMGLAGLMAGGGQKGGGGGMGGLLGAGFGGLMGLGAGIAGALDTSQGDLLSQIRRQVRKGTRFAEAEAAQSAYDFLSDPAAVAFQNQIRSLYGLDPVTGPGEVGFANPFESGSRFYLAEPSQLGMKRLADLGKRRRRPVVQASKQFAAVSEALAMEGAGDLTAKEQRRIQETLSEENLAATYGSLEQLTETQRNLLAERLQRKFGMGAGGFEETFREVAARSGNEAALPPTAQPGEAAPGFTPLIDDLRARIQQGQQARGLFHGVGPATAEAAGLSTYLQTQRLQNLGLLTQAAGMPQQVYQQALQPALQKNIFERTGGAVAYGTPNPYLSQAAPGAGARIQGAIFDTLSGAALGGAIGKSF